jgi:DNA-binding transcriptional regulator YiaG
MQGNGETIKKDDHEIAELRKQLDQIALLLKLIQQLDIARIRRVLHMSQEELARALGVSYRTVARWEHRRKVGESPLSMFTVLLLKLRNLLRKATGKTRVSSFTPTTNHVHHK